jgi:predicted nucleotidyltransferase
VIRSSIVASLRELAVSIGPVAHGTEWHLFGSVDRDEPDAADIDLMILCKSNVQADVLRQTIDPDSLALPIHLSLMTFDEAAAIDVVQVQRSTIIFP